MQAIISRRIRNFVSNGNTLILTGGDYSSLVFLNKYFHYEVKKVSLKNISNSRATCVCVPVYMHVFFKKHLRNKVMQVCYGVKLFVV